MKDTSQWQNNIKQNYLNSIRYFINHPEVFCKTGVPRNISKFARKHLCPILFFYKVADFFREHLGWLLLDIFHWNNVFGKVSLGYYYKT